LKQLFYSFPKDSINPELLKSFSDAGYNVILCQADQFCNIGLDRSKIAFDCTGSVYTPEGFKGYRIVLKNK